MTYFVVQYKHKKADKKAMGIFNIFTKKQQQPTVLNMPSEDDILTAPHSAVPQQAEIVAAPAQGIQLLYNYLQDDFERKGYQDALISPDESYKQDNIKLIKYDMQILMHQVNTYHETVLKDLDFHISSRTRAGLIDLVEELKIKKIDLLAHRVKVQELERDLEQNKGLCERAILSYKRGFMKGLAAITQNYLLNKKF